MPWASAILLGIIRKENVTVRELRQPIDVYVRACALCMNAMSTLVVVAIA